MADLVSSSPLVQPDKKSARITVEEIACRLSIGRIAAYTMLERGIIPAVRLGRRWIVTRQAYDQWERTCGTRDCVAHKAQPEVSVVN